MIEVDQVVDMVNHPPHYTAGKVECIEALEAAAVGDTDPFGCYLRLQAIKYLWRCGKKWSDVEDLKKAVFYINRLVAYKQGKEPQT
mgnify:CR=1 FL=1